MNGRRLNQNTNDNDSELCALSTLEPGRRGTIVSLPKELISRQRLLNLGISPGKIFEINHSAAYGPTVVMIGEQRIALDSQLAAQVMVVAEPQEDQVWSATMARLKRIWSLP